MSAIPTDAPTPHVDPTVVACALVLTSLVAVERMVALAAGVAGSDRAPPVPKRAVEVL